MTFLLIGAGSRGMTYARWAVKHGMQISAIAEIRPERLAHAAQELHVPADRCFTDVRDAFSLGRIADSAIVATMDRDHYLHTIQALELGYDILLEKPISPDPRECLEIEAKANSLGRRITVCHVLRYSEFFLKIKEIVDSGTIGKIVAIKHSENIGNFHMAHSFVRGNWANSEFSSPIILQKSCHDLDILAWLVDSPCKQVAAFGSLSYFTEAHAPENSADRCMDCPAAAGCRYDARKCYLPALGSWPTDVVCLEQTEEALYEALKNGPYGRCVYRCDNNVCDHMSCIFAFENGVTATFSLTAQTDRIHRNIHIMCEDGELLADDATGDIILTRFGSNEVEPAQSTTIHIYGGRDGHNGGDPALMRDFTQPAAADGNRTSITRSIESHLMAFAAEESRLTGRVITLDEFRSRF